MKVNYYTKAVTFTGEDGETLKMRTSNMGEPYRDGVDFSVETLDEDFCAFFEVSELRRMQKFLNEYLGEKNENR